MMDKDQTDAVQDDVRMILVRATAKGYFGKVIEPDQGDASEFYVPEGTTGSWFEPAYSEPAAEAKGSRRGRARQEADRDVI